jgi:Mg2+ and Co2+ transporter CorA
MSKKQKEVQEKISDVISNLRANRTGELNRLVKRREEDLNRAASVEFTNDIIYDEVCRAIRRYYAPRLEKINRQIEGISMALGTISVSTDDFMAILESIQEDSET